MKQEEEFELIVHEANRPIWQTIIAGLLFTFMFYLLYHVVMLFYNFGYSDDTMRTFASFFYLIVCCIVAGFAFSVVKSVLIDVDKDILILRYYLGRFSYDSVSPAPSLEYVSVFRDGYYSYQVNLWYIGNKHFVMCDFNDSASAFIFAQDVAKKLKLDLLDATVRGDFKWVEVEQTEIH